MPVTSARVVVDRFCDYLDASGRRVAVIRVNVTRHTALRFCGLQARGGPLFYRGRRILTRETGEPDWTGRAARDGAPAVNRYRCDCGDTECPSCGTAQGTLAADRRRAPRPLRVFGWQGTRFECPPAPNGSRQTREIVAAKSAAAAARAAGRDRPAQLFNFCETGNAAEIRAARGRPGVVLWRPIDLGRPWFVAAGDPWQLPPPDVVEDLRFMSLTLQAFGRPVQNETVTQAIAHIVQLRSLLGDLLATIHADGGHHQAAVGTERATRDAIAKWHARTVDLDRLRGPREPPHCATCDCGIAGSDADSRK